MPTSSKSSTTTASEARSSRPNRSALSMSRSVRPARSWRGNTAPRGSSPRPGSPCAWPQASSPIRSICVRRRRPKSTAISWHGSRNCAKWTSNSTLRNSSRSARRFATARLPKWSERIARSLPSLEFVFPSLRSKRPDSICSGIAKKNSEKGSKSCPTNSGCTFPRCS